MGDLMGSATLGAIAAMGYAMAKTILAGLATSGWWIFPVMAVVSLAYSALRPVSDSQAPSSFFRHLVAVAVAALLLYGHNNVDLSTVVGDRLSLGGTGTVTQGAAPLPTYWVDTVGTAVSSTAKHMVTNGGAFLVPMLSNVVREATANPQNLADKQVAANLSIWRFLAAAAMQADSTLAGEIQRRGLLHRLQNPVPGIPDYSSPTAVGELNQVSALLDGANGNASLGTVVCNNITQVNKLAQAYGAAAWVPDGGCDSSPGRGVTLSVVGGATTGGIAQAQSPGGFTDPLAVAKAAQGAAALSKIIGDSQGAITQTHFGSLSEVYRSVGAGALVSAAVQAAQDDSFKVLLGEQCIQKGMPACLNSFSPVYHALGETVDTMDQETKNGGPSFLDMLQSSFWKTVAGSIAFVVGALMTLFAKLVAALTPFAIAMARAVAIIVSILGIYVMLLPGRFSDAIKWMIGPIAWANVWSLLFVFWWKVSEFFNDWGHRLFWGSDGLSGDGISGAAVIGFVTAVGYTALPHIAWKLVFAMPERLMPHGGVGSMLTPAIRVMMAAGAAVGVKKIGRWLAGGSGASGSTSGGGGGGGGSGGGSPGGNGRPLPSNSATRLRAAEFQNIAKGQGARSSPVAKPVSNPARSAPS